MAGAVQSFINRLIAAGYAVAIKDEVTLISSIGIVAAVSYVDVGHYQVDLREPGVTFDGPPGHEVIPSATVVNTAPAYPTVVMVSSVRMDVFLWDSAGSPIDQPFTFQILLSERFGGRPLPAPGN